MPYLRALLLTLIGFTACDAPAPEWRGSVADSAGVEFISNPQTPVNASVIVPREALRIGAIEGERHLQFGNIAALAVSPSGRIHVLDQQNRCLRVFDEGGAFLHEVCGAGGGPGEFSAFAIGLMATSGDTAIVADPGNRRFTLFSPDGAFAGEIPMPFPSGTLPQRFALLPDGRFLEMARTAATPENPELRDDVLLEVNRKGQVRDTVHRMPTSQSVRFHGQTVQFAAYHAEPIWALDRTGQLLAAMSDEYRIEVRGPDGGLRRVIVREHTARPVTDADRNAFLNMIRRTMTEQRVDPALIEQMVHGMSFADHYPAFTYFVPGPRGSLWVQHVRTAVDAAAEGEQFDATDVGSERWDVFDAHGRFIAEARLPRRYNPLTSLGDRLYGMWRDELDVQHILVLEVAGLPDHGGV